MFGKNSPRPKAIEPGALQVHSIWYTVQGEGPFMGLPATFVRFSGCTLSCFWCDTIWDDERDPLYLVDELVDRVLAVTPEHCSLIVLTGGEPLRQSLSPFVERLVHRWQVQRGQGSTPKIQVETSGSVYDSVVTLPEVWTVVSPKTAFVHPEIAAHAFAYKYVLREGEISLDDGLPNVSTQRPGERVGVKLARPLPGYKGEIFVSPCDEYFVDGKKNSEATAANYRLVRDVAMKFGYRVSLQMHKHIEAE